jgi:hypothetical protein
MTQRSQHALAVTVATVGGKRGNYEKFHDTADTADSRRKGKKTGTLRIRMRGELQ